MLWGALGGNEGLHIDDVREDGYTEVLHGNNPWGSRGRGRAHLARGDRLQSAVVVWDDDADRERSANEEQPESRIDGFESAFQRPPRTMDLRSNDGDIFWANNRE